MPRTARKSVATVEGQSSANDAREGPVWLEEHSRLNHQADLVVFVEIRSESESSRQLVDSRVRDLAARKKQAALRSRRQGQGPGATIRSIEHVRRIAVRSRSAASTARLDVLSASCEGESVVERISGENRRPIGFCATINADVRFLFNAGVLQIGRNGERPAAVRIDDIEDVAVVLRQRRGKRRFFRVRQVAAASKGNGAGRGDDIGNQARYPAVRARIEPVVERQCGIERTVAVRPARRG